MLGWKFANLKRISLVIFVGQKHCCEIFPPALGKEKRNAGEETTTKTRHRQSSETIFTRTGLNLEIFTGFKDLDSRFKKEHKGIESLSQLTKSTPNPQDRKL